MGEGGAHSWTDKEFERVGLIKSARGDLLGGLNDAPKIFRVVIPVRRGFVDGRGRGGSFGRGPGLESGINIFQHKSGPRKYFLLCTESPPPLA
jgi:hypothetical protein